MKLDKLLISLILTSMCSKVVALECGESHVSGLPQSLRVIGLQQDSADRSCADLVEAERFWVEDQSYETTRIDDVFYRAKRDTLFGVSSEISRSLVSGNGIAFGNGVIQRPKVKERIVIDTLRGFESSR